MISNLKKCKTCGLRGTYQDGSPGCAKFKVPVDPEKDYCSWHLPETSVISCDICHNKIPSKDCLINDFDGKLLITCQKCITYLHTCNTCKHQSTCDFMNDHSEPSVIMKTIHQGMMTMQTQIKNPNLVQKHCIHCQCSYGDQGDCLKESNGDGCPNWLILPELLQ